jgi:transcription initiation factor IIE alpha subunit
VRPRKRLEETRAAIVQWQADFQQLRHQIDEDARRHTAALRRSVSQLRQLAASM